jgi:hypothetical protein
MPLELQLRCNRILVLMKIFPNFELPGISFWGENEHILAAGAQPFQSSNALAHGESLPSFR